MTVEIRSLEKESMPDTMTVNDAEYRVVKLLGKGKGGYSYLVTDGTAQYVLKQIHHEPCAYYTFGDKLRSCGTMKRCGSWASPCPGLWRRPSRRSAFCHSENCTVSRLYPAGLNIDYYPTNFVPCGGTLYYIDYECNAYMQEWDFAHWGARYWTIQAPEKPDEA